MTTRRLRGMSQSRPLRLCTRAPRIEIGSSKSGAFTSGPNIHSSPKAFRCRDWSPHAKVQASGQLGMKKALKKPSRTPVQDRGYQQALDIFTKGVKALGRKDFD